MWQDAEARIRVCYSAFKSGYCQYADCSRANHWAGCLSAKQQLRVSLKRLGDLQEIEWKRGTRIDGLSCTGKDWRPNVTWNYRETEREREDFQWSTRGVAQRLSWPHTHWPRQMGANLPSTVQRWPMTKATDHQIDLTVPRSSIRSMYLCVS